MQTFGVDDRVSVVRPISLQPYTVLKTGETGTVVRLVEDMGISGVEVRLDQKHKALSEWDNVALLTEPEIDGLRKLKLSSSGLPPLAAVAAVVSTLAAVHVVTFSTLMRLFT